MGRRADHTRTELRQMILDAATDLIDREGPAGLTARAVARRIGYSVGTIYNLFEDLDDLVWQVNGRTLDGLHANLAAAAGGAGAELRVRRLAQAYLDFVTTYPRRWASVLERRPQHASEPPRWYRERIRRLFDLAETALAGYFPADAAERRRRSAHVLWAGLTGIALLLETASMPADTGPAALVAALVDTHLAGIAGSAPKRRPAAKPPVPRTSAARRRR
jgi:AcrR family transcriptional regulator